MNKLEKMLSKWNFKKIAVWYLIVAVIAGIACAATVGYIYKDRLNFAWQYSRLEEAKQPDALQAAAEKTAAASDDVVDVLILDDNNNVTYSAKHSEFADGAFVLSRVGDEKKYLASDSYPDAVFQYVKSEEFMFTSIVNKDFGEIRRNYDDDSAFESNLSSKTIYMLNLVKAHDNGSSRVCIITLPTSVAGGTTALKATAALAMLFFCIYWVLVALWMYRDAARCKLSPIYWGLIGLLTNLVGLIVYKIYKRSTALCGNCGAAQSAEHLYCSFCGAKLGERCENCGSKISPKDSFCHHCGKKIK